MKLMNEIIITDPIIEQEEINPEIKELSYEEIDNIPYEYDPEIMKLFEMCPECKALGYCKKTKVVLEDSFIRNLVPLAVEGELYQHKENYSVKQLQASFNAFHQHDYETAILNSGKILIEIKERDRKSKELSMAFLVLAVCQYFFRNYRLAGKHYEHYLMFNPEYVRFEGDESMEHFMWHCENLMNKPA